MRRVAEGYPNKVFYDDRDSAKFPGHIVESLTRVGGVLHEVYGSPPHYFWRYDVGLNWAADDELVQQGTSFLLDVIGNVTPVEAADVESWNDA